MKTVQQRRHEIHKRLAHPLFGDPSQIVLLKELELLADKETCTGCDGEGERDEECPTCGNESGEIVKCSACHGLGYVE